MRSKIINETKFRRRKLSLTNYKKRLAMVKGGLDRVVVRKSNKNIMGQIVRYDEKGDAVIASADSKELASEARGLRSTPLPAKERSSETSSSS